MLFLGTDPVTYGGHTVSVFDLVSRIWQPRAEPPWTQGEAVARAAGGLLVWVGARGRTPGAVMAVYDVANDEWTHTPADARRHGAAALPLADGTVLVLGGRDGGGIVTPLLFDPRRRGSGCPT